MNKKILILSGSPRKGGNTELGISEMVRIFEDAGIETETVQVGNLDIRGCQACNACYKLGRCVYDDAVNEPTFRLAHQLFEMSADVRRTGSAALDLCWTACGRFGLFAGITSDR